MKKAFFYNMWIFPNLPQNVDKIPNSKGPWPRTKNDCDGPDDLRVKKLKVLNLLHHNKAGLYVAPLLQW